MASKAAKRKAKARRRTGYTEPPERLVVKERLQVGDETTTVAYAADSVTLMLNNGSICKRLAAAGVRFRSAFNEASISDVCAVNWNEPSGMRSCAPLWPPGSAGWVSWAREVQPALNALGGPENPMRAVAWHVLGMGRSVNDFARNIGWAGERPRDRKAAVGILTAALSTLADHYENKPKTARGVLEQQLTELAQHVS